MKYIKRISAVFISGCTLLAGIGAAAAAETVSLTLNLNGKVVQGESTLLSQGRANTIECTSFNLLRGNGAKAPIELVIQKRIDKSSPALFEGAASNAVVKGAFRFFRPNPTGDGTTQAFYTVNVIGRIKSVRQLVKDTTDAASASSPPLDEVAFTVDTLTFSYMGAAPAGGGTPSLVRPARP